MGKLKKIVAVPDDLNTRREIVRVIIPGNLEIDRKCFQKSAKERELLKIAKTRAKEAV